MNNDSQYFSKTGLEQLKKELELLKTLKRKEIAERLEFAKSLGDLSENAEYSEAKEAQMLNESKIAELEDLLRRAVLVGEDIGKEKVDIGSKVVLSDGNGNQTFTVVGSKESAPQENKISNESPLGAAILGHKKTETVVVETPKGKREYKIIEIL